MNSTPIRVVSRPPKFPEVSPLRNRREEDSPQRQWRKSGQLSAVAEQHGQAIEGLQRQILALRKRDLGSVLGDRIRLFLCDSVTGVGQYYLVAAEVDPDQEPAAA